MAEFKEYAFAGVMSAIGAGIFVYGFNRMAKYRLIQDTPRSKVRSIALGIVEVHGTAKAETYLKTPFSQSDCVYYKYEIMEYRARTTTDSKGRPRTTYRWETVATGEKREDFFAKDETGEVMVRPEGAEIKVPVKRVFLQKAGVFGNLGIIVKALTDWNSVKSQRLDTGQWNLTELNPKTRVHFGSRVGDRKYYEYFISPDENLFVLGTAASDTTAPNKMVIKKGENEKTFMITTKSEKELLKTLLWSVIGCFGFGGLLFVGGIMLILYFAGML